MDQNRISQVFSFILHDGTEIYPVMMRRRETEDQEMLPPGLDEQVAADIKGHLLEPDEETLDEEAREELHRVMDPEK